MSPVKNWTLGIALAVPLIGGLSAATDHWPRATPAIATTPPAVHRYDDPADTLYQEARAALARGDNRQAARLFRRIVDEEPNSEYAPDAPYWQAFALYRVGGKEAMNEALAALDLQRERYPDAATRGDADALAVRIRGVLARGGDADAAQRVYEVAGEAETAYEVDSDCPDEETDVRVAAINALMEMDAERALPVLEKVLARRDPCSETLRRKAVFIVADGDSPRATDILLEVARTDPDAETRGQAVFWLSEVDDPRAVDALEQILQESRDTELREKALFALSENDDERAGQILRRYALDSSQPEEIREKALFWLAEREGGGDVAFLRELYARVESESLKEKVLYAASEADDPESIAWLFEIATDGSQSVELRKQALFWAGESNLDSVGPRLLGLYDDMSDPEIKNQLLFVYSELDTPDAIDKLFEIARTERDPELQKQALFWLGESDDPRVAEFLEELISQ
ncbi:MAG TPA: HEAT repeat domain-containing protein [Gemmatimonadota bacterium]|jgi:HEAT repeat protein